jgi:flavin-binding protein dodecin
MRFVVEGTGAGKDPHESRLTVVPCGYQSPEKPKTRGVAMSDSVYKVIELVGTSTESWEEAATAAVNRAGQTLRDLRVAEISQLDMQLVDGKVAAYRAKVKVSFKYEG